jgi:hypothetical protein
MRILKPGMKASDVYKSPLGEKAGVRKFKQPQNPLLEKNKVTVQYNPKEASIIIYVHATHGDGSHKMKGSIPVRSCLNAKDLISKVMATAGACAELLCDRFGDNLDPDKCAHSAREVLKEVMLKVYNDTSEKKLFMPVAEIPKQEG